MKITIDSAFIEHLIEFQNITDEEIELRATSKDGILDAEEALLLHLERDLVQSYNKSFAEELLKTRL